MANWHAFLCASPSSTDPHHHLTGFLAANLFPNRVGRLGEEQIGLKVLGLQHEQAAWPWSTTNDFRSALQRIDSETSDYYVPGYYSSNDDTTRRVRRIEVKVGRDDITVWSRSSYTLKPKAPARD